MAELGMMPKQLSVLQTPRNFAESSWVALEAAAAPARRGGRGMRVGLAKTNIVYQPKKESAFCYDPRLFICQCATRRRRQRLRLRIG